jgi:hypothetical protein
LKLPVTALNFIFIDSSIEAKDLVNMELENQGKQDSFKFQASELILRDSTILEKIFPGIKYIDMAQTAKGFRVWGGLAYVGGVDLNAIFFVFLGDDGSVQVRLQYNANKLNGPTREEILNSIVDVIKS